MKIELVADKVNLRGPRIDGGYVLSFEVGEYMKEKLSEIVKLPNDSNLKVTIELYNE